MTVSRRRFVAGATAAAATAPALVRTSTATAAPARTPGRDPRLPDPASVPLDSPADLSLLQTASVLQAGRLSAVELATACLERSRARDGATTAWIRLYPEVALGLARTADRRLATARRTRTPAPLLTGVPLALKDLYAAKGLPLTASSKVLAGNIAEADSTAWARLKAAGMVLLGHAETDEFAFGVGTIQTGNPWDPTRSPGGSSGGSGAVLGARFVPAALGSDTGGSLRLPATACGITALKPTFGRVSAYGVIPLCWSRDVAGPMARSAADTSLLLSTLAGADPHDAATLGAPDVPRGGYPLVPTPGRKPYAGMRFGVLRADAEALPAGTTGIYARFLREVQALGGTLVDVELPPAPAPEPLPTGVVGELSEAGLYHQQFLPTSLAGYSPDYAALVTALVASQKAVTAVDYMRYNQGRQAYQHAYHRLFRDQRLTAVLLPGSTGDGATRRDLAGINNLSGNVPGNVVWANTAGVPVITTPAGFSTETGMPFGVQIGGRAWDEVRLLQLAIDHQHRYPYWKKRPEPLLVPRAIPTARVVAVTPTVHDPTGTITTRPFVTNTPTRLTDEVALSPGV